MQILNTQKTNISQILKYLRRQQSQSDLVKMRVTEILTTVKKTGDQALFYYSNKFDGVNLSSLKVKKYEIIQAYKQVDKQLTKALIFAKTNIEKFQKTTLRKKEKIIETARDVKVWREFRPIEKVGLYVPGGTAAYPSSVLMLAIPAQIAGCKKIIICSPPDKQGKCNPAVLVAADICGVTDIYKIGGAQAIAAMAYGTKSVPKVYKIFGPGNQYVTTAKILVYGEVDIDMPAGPSEIMILADTKANSKWLAADLLSQLEHGQDSQSILITNSKTLANQVKKELWQQLKTTSRQAIVRQAYQKSFIIIVKNWQEAIKIANEYAPEHLEIITKNKNQIKNKINNAGSIFLGPYSSEPLGDYVTGANHTLPTSGFAKTFSALSVESFGKMIQIQKINKTGFKAISKPAIIMALSEGLFAHSAALKIRK